MRAGEINQPPKRRTHSYEQANTTVLNSMETQTQDIMLANEVAEKLSRIINQRKVKNCFGVFANPTKLYTITVKMIGAITCAIISANVFARK